jgi:antitoxin VapB
MALSIKTDEADRLARKIASITGETLTEAVTVALRERCERVARVPDADRLTRMREFVQRVSPEFDRRPVTKEEWDEASGDTD